MTERRLLEESARRLERLWRVTQSTDVAVSLYRALFEMGLGAGYPTGRGIGHTAGAEPHLARAVEISRWVLDHTPEKEVGHYALAGRLGLLGWAHREYGQLEQALASYVESQEEANKAAGLPQESERRQMLASNQQQIGRILSAMGKRGEAKASMEASVRGFRLLTEEDAMNVGYQRGLAASLAYLAAIEQDEPANAGSARQHAAEALRILKAIVNQDPKNEKAKAELREFETLLRSTSGGRVGQL